MSLKLRTCILLAGDISERNSINWCSHKIRIFARQELVGNLAPAPATSLAGENFTFTETVIWSRLAVSFLGTLWYLDNAGAFCVWDFCMLMNLMAP